MCAYLSDKGVKVSMWGRDADKTAELCKKGISVTGCCQGVYHPTAIADIAEAAASSQYLFVMTTSNGHRPVAEALKGKISAGQKIVIFNGNWGACEFYAVLSQELETKNAVVSETGAMIFLADYVGEALHIKKIKDNISLAAIPSHKAKEIVDDLKDVLPQLVLEKNVLSTSINNSNPVIHTPVTLFSITRIENGEDFLFYADAATRSVIGFIEKIDAERCRVAEAIGASPVSCLEIINSFWPEKYDNLYDAIRCNVAYMTGKGPKTLDYRYVNEDVPYGMAAVAALGKKYGVATPYIDAMLLCYYGLIAGLDELTPDFSQIDVRRFC